MRETFENNVYRVAIGAMIANQILPIIIFIYLVWSMFFMFPMEIGFGGAVLYFIALGFFCWFVMMIPLIGMSLLPVLFDWMWHDIPINEIGTIPWTLTAIALIINIIFFAFSVWEDNHGRSNRTAKWE